MNLAYFSLFAALWMLVPTDWWQLNLSDDNAWLVQHALPFGIAFAVLCALSFLGAVATHNTVHCPIFKQRWLNKIYQVVLSLVYGHPVSSYVPGHNLSHHKHTESRRDVMRTTKARLPFNQLNLLFFFFMVAPSIMKADGSYTKEMRTRHPKWYRQMKIELIVLMALNVLFVWLDWQKAILLWFVPHIYAQWGIVTMNLLQHDGCDADTDYNHSRNFVGNVVNWWTFNNGYHTIHHETPGLHWSLLPAAHAEKIAPHIHPNLDQKSLIGYLFQAYFLGRRRRYDGTPFVLAEAGRDEKWIPDPRATIEDLGAESLDSEHGGINAYVAHAQREL